jgi:hypothetical protein
MSQWHELAHFLYGRGFWYVDPLREIKGLKEEQLYWLPDRNSLCLLWQVGHIAHRESYHISTLLQGEEPLTLPRYECFGTDWSPVDAVRAAGPASEVFDWLRQVRAETHAYIDTLRDEDWARVPPTAPDGLSIAHWVFITVSHTALHIGQIQQTRALLEGELQRAC